MMEAFPKKSYFKKNDQVTIIVSTENKILPDKIEIKVYHLDELCYETDALLSDKQTYIQLDMCFDTGVSYWFVCKNSDGETAECAFEVSDKPFVFRYGFLSDFESDDVDDTDIETMAKHHINMVQYYDWSYRHDSLVSDTDEYIDMMGKAISGKVVKRKIRECHERNMLSIGYGAVYAASNEFADKHNEWRLFADEKKPIKFIEVFSIMNLFSEWREHIIGQYKRAINQMGFDGIHMDTYGFPKTAYDYEGTVIHLEDCFPLLIEDTKKELEGSTFVFNNVGGWPVRSTMNTSIDAVYIEVWPPYDRFVNLRELILTAREAKKPVMIAAYPQTFRTDERERAIRAQIISMCAINLLGATQLWFGEKNAVITQGYYSDYSIIDSEQELLYRKYDDFFVRYEEIIFDDELQDVSMTHCGWDNHEYIFGENTSPDGRENTLWTIIKEKPGRKVIAFVNLCGNDDKWNEGKNRPEIQKDVVLSVQIFDEIHKIAYASPDIDNGRLTELQYETKMMAEGKAITISIPFIEYAGMLLIE